MRKVVVYTIINNFQMELALSVYLKYLYILCSVCAHFEPKVSKMCSTNSLKMYKYFWNLFKATAPNEQNV